MSQKMKSFVPSPAFKAFMELAAAEAKDILDMREYRVSFEFVPSISGYRHIPDSAGYTFEVECDLVYMDLKISASKTAQNIFEAGELRSLREDIIHELAHALTTPIIDAAFGNRKPSKLVTNLDENLTQRITAIASKQLK